MKPAAIPNDADGDAIRRVLSHGSDMARPMKIDFHVAVPDEEAGRKIAAAALSRHYETDVSRDTETGAWTCSCSRTMLLDHSELLRCQAELGALSAPHGGYSDGWGTFGNARAG